MKKLTAVLKIPKCPKCKTNEFMLYYTGDDNATCQKCGTEYEVDFRYDGGC